MNYEGYYLFRNVLDKISVQPNSRVKNHAYTQALYAIANSNILKIKSTI